MRLLTCFLTRNNLFFLLAHNCSHLPYVPHLHTCTHRTTMHMDAHRLQRSSFRTTFYSRKWIGRIEKHVFIFFLFSSVSKYHIIVCAAATACIKLLSNISLCWLKCSKKSYNHDDSVFFLPLHTHTHTHAHTQISISNALLHSPCTVNASRLFFLPFITDE